MNINESLYNELNSEFSFLGKLKEGQKVKITGADTKKQNFGKFVIVERKKDEGGLFSSIFSFSKPKDDEITQMDMNKLYSKVDDLSLKTEQYLKSINNKSFSEVELKKIKKLYKKMEKAQVGLRNISASYDKRQITAKIEKLKEILKLIPEQAKLKTGYELKDKAGNLLATLGKNGFIIPTSSIGGLFTEIPTEEKLIEVIHAMLEKNLPLDIPVSGMYPLHIAINNKDFELAKRLLENKANPNRLDEEQKSPLYKLLKIATELSKERDKNKIDQIRSLLKLLIHNGADVNKEITKKLTALHWITKFATEPDQMEIIELLINYGANVNALSPEGTTPLIMAAKYNNQTMMKLLLQKGADPLVINKAGVTALQATDDPKCKEILSDLDQVLSEKILEVKSLAHRFGIEMLYEINHSPFALLGLTPKQNWLEQLTNSLALYSKDNPTSPIPDEIYQVIQNVKQNYQKSTEELFNEIKNGKPVLLLTGWQEHATCDIIYKDLYIQANRGQRGGERDLDHSQNAGFYIYKIEKNENLPLVLEKLKELRNLSEDAVSDPSREYLTKTIHQDLQLKYIDHLELSEQKVGNCTWASPKTALASLIYVSGGLKDQELDPIAAKHAWKVQGHKTYKGWTAWDREMSLNKFFLPFESGEITPSPSDLQLLLFILAKFKGSKQLQDRLFAFLINHKEAIDWTATDLKGMSFYAHAKKSGNQSLLENLQKEDRMIWQKIIDHASQSEKKRVENQIELVLKNIESEKIKLTRSQLQSLIQVFARSNEYSELLQKRLWDFVLNNKNQINWGTKDQDGLGFIEHALIAENYPVLMELRSNHQEIWKKLKEKEINLGDANWNALESLLRDLMINQKIEKITSWFGFSSKESP